MSTLALTMIVRDEADQLPGFLSHHAELADEVIIVDTGSRDETRDIARGAGARVIEHAWQDDFAAARNAGLTAVSSDWVLILDADERVSRADFPLLRAALPVASNRAFLQETWNYCLGTSHLEWQPLSGRYPAEEAGQTGLFVARRVGLFPAERGLRFHGRVHESVLPSVVAAGLAVVPLQVPVHHYGYCRSEAANLERQARYRRLAELKLADDPTDPAAQLELATALLEGGDAAAALSRLRTLAAGPAGLRPVVRGLVLLGRLEREMGDLQEARKLLTEAVRQDPDFVFAWLERIRVEAEAGDWSAARGLLETAEGRFGPQQPQLLREALRIQIKTRQLPAALASAERLVGFCPQWQEIRDLAARLRRMPENNGEA